VDRLGGRREPAMVGDRDEQPQPAKIHNQIIWNWA
jgi:hypothetical protein